MYPAAPENTALVQLHDHARREARRLRREAVNEFLVRRFTHSTPTTTQKA